MGRILSLLGRLWRSILNRLLPPTVATIKPASQNSSGQTTSQAGIAAEGGQMAEIAPAKAAEKIATPLRKRPRHSGWNILPQEPLPHPTYWPVVAAGGVVLLAFGFVTSFFFWAIGFVIFVAGIVGWIGEIRFERKHRS